jgi:hypothetical protein
MRRWFHGRTRSRMSSVQARRKGRCWRPLSNGFAGAITWWALGCSLALDREHDQCRTSSDCQHLAPGAVCTTRGICERVTGFDSPGSAPFCLRDADCGDLSLCRDATCHVLERSGCTVVADPAPDELAERLPIAVLLPASENESRRISNAVRTVVDGWNEVRNLDPELPEVLALVCQANDAPALQSAIDAGVTLVVAATRVDELQTVLDTVDGRAAVFTPFAEAPALRDLVPEAATSVVSCKPNRASSITSLISAISQVRWALDHIWSLDPAGFDPDRPTVVALSKHEDRYGYTELVRDAAADDPSIVPVVYDSELEGEGLVAALTRLSLQPALLVGISGEVDWSSNLSAVENSELGGAEPPPFYLLTDRQADVLSVATFGRRPTDLDAPVTAQPTGRLLHERIVFVDYQLEQRNEDVRQRFADELRAATDNASNADLDLVHDCLYLAGYAALAAQQRYSIPANQLRPGSVLVGLRALVGGQSLPIGPDRLPEGRDILARTRSDDGSLDLIGASGNLNPTNLPHTAKAASSLRGFYVAPSATALQFYCIDGTGRLFAPTGPTISETTEFTWIGRCPFLALR